MNRTTQASNSIPLTRPPEIKNNDEQKILVIGTASLTVFRILTAPFRWVWNHTYRPLRNLVRKFGLGRVSAKANRADDLAHYRQRIEQILAENKSPRPPATKPAAAPASHISLATSSGSHKIETKYVPLETQDLEDLRGALMNLTKTATDIFYEEHLKQFIELADETFFPQIKKFLPVVDVAMGGLLSPTFLALNGPVIPLLLNGSGPSLEDREKKVKQWLDQPENKMVIDCFHKTFPDADFKEPFEKDHILYLEHQSMKNSLKDVYGFLLKGANLREIAEEEGQNALQLHVKRAGSEDKKEEVAEYFKVIAGWLREDVGGNEPFECWIEGKISSDIDMRLMADCYALMTKRLLKDKAVELIGKRIPGLAEKLPAIIDETRETIVPKVADHLIVQGVTALHEAPMDKIIDNSVNTFCQFLDTSLEAQNKADFFVLLKEKGIHYPPEMAKSGVTEEWVKEHICEPLRDMLLPNLISEEGSSSAEEQVEIVGNFLARIANEIKLPKDLMKQVTFGYKLAKGFMPSSYVTGSIKEYEQFLVGVVSSAKDKGILKKNIEYKDLLERLNEQTPQVYHAFKLFALQQIVDRVLAGVITPRIHTYLQPEKIEKLLGDDILPVVNETLMKTFIGMILAKEKGESLRKDVAAILENDNRQLTEDCLDKISDVIFEKLKEEFPIGGTLSGYLSNRFYPEDNRPLYREKLQDILAFALKGINDENDDLSLAIYAVASSKSERKCSPEELRPYQALLQSVIMNAGGFKNFWGGLINTGFNAILNNALAPLMVRALDEYRLNSDEVIRKATSVINEKLLARDPSLPPSNSSDVKETLLYTKFMGPSREEPKKSCEKEAFYPSFKEECELLAAMIYDAARFEAGQKGWIASKAVTAVLGNNEKKLADVIKSVAVPILKRPMVLELLISRVAEDTLRQLHPANRIASTHAEDATESS